MIHYFNPNQESALYDFIRTLSKLIHKHKGFQEVVVICIGSDRATGDSLGPIVGHLLSMQQKNFHLFGTLENPVHAKNLEAAIHIIRNNHPNCLLIAIDASLGIEEHIGYITLGEGALAPGVGVSKNLPAVGDLFITGIVNLSGGRSQTLLQTTRLSLVMHQAEFIYQGLFACLNSRYLALSYSKHTSKLSSSLQRAE